MYYDCVPIPPLSLRNSCSPDEGIILQTENERFTSGLGGLAREKHYSVTGREDVFADITIVLFTSQAKKFPQSQSLPWDESKRERGEQIAFKAKPNPSTKSAMTEPGSQMK